MTHHIPHIPHLAHVAMHSIVSSPTVLEGRGEGIDEKDSSQVREEIQDTEDVFILPNTYIRR
jgi:hypothetical protein